MFTDWQTVKRHWKGYNALNHLVIFGASYCDVGYSSKEPHPCKERPLGVEFPGRTYNEPGEPNWVGHIVRDLSPCSSSPLLAYDYAVGGQDVHGVGWQVDKLFLPDVGKKPEWARWCEEDTLFITWVGINDCARAAFAQSTHEASLKRLFVAQDKLYENGARNFLFIDVPPLHRLRNSAFGAQLASNFAASFETWNKFLRAEASLFSERHEDATVMIFSSWKLFSAVLDHPETYGFSLADATRSGGKIWVDNLHPTSKMHGVIAEEMVSFLNNVPADDPPLRQMNCSS
ncbi:hypothetical protein BD410DRAFT_789564 [Rickenella mellea]|uniref:Carbohydrate esterase family 16 protein n=1 Tax=Rickenella mellea TaxID=50990 RepID=A0A4Y7Q3J9_9AGAM|nr:hypothetical protein BD410DRAFT_789564 [Rickenella mellea]